jgi:hypothetical protein
MSTLQDAWASVSRFFDEKNAEAFQAILVLDEQPCD